MRPVEILSMIEEAAGTSMFEEKKDKAVKTMSKKEKKLEEIQSLLKEEIVPKLDRLREEKRVFLEFQKTSSELERLGKLVIAWDWLQDHKRVEKAKAAIREGEGRKKEAGEAKKRMEGEIKKMEQSMTEIEKQRDRVSCLSFPYRQQHFNLHQFSLTSERTTGTRQGRKSPGTGEAAQRARHGDRQAQDAGAGQGA
jgi:chromosome segregation ATPase